MRIYFFLAFIVALSATLGSLFYSEIQAFVPCKLCWFQRILMYPLVLILFFQTMRKQYYLGPAIIFSTLGIFLALYHYLLQNGWIGDVESACSRISCGIKFVNYFGFVTIPFLSLTAFCLITILLIIGKKKPSIGNFS